VTTAGYSIEDIPLGPPRQGARLEWSERPSPGLHKGRCIACRHLVVLEGIGHGCERTAVDADRDVTRMIYCRHYSPMGRQP